MIFKIIDDIRLIYPLIYAFKVLQKSLFFKGHQCSSYALSDLLYNLLGKLFFGHN